MAAGIVDCIEDTDAVMEYALRVARDYATIPPGTFAAVKRQIRGAVIDKINHAMAHGANSLAKGWFNAETKLAMAQMIG